MRKSEEMWDNEFDGIHGSGCGIEGYMDAQKEGEDGIGSEGEKPDKKKP